MVIKRFYISPDKWAFCVLVDQAKMLGNDFPWSSSSLFIQIHAFVHCFVICFLSTICVKWGSFRQSSWLQSLSKSFRNSSLIGTKATIRVMSKNYTEVSQKKQQWETLQKRNRASRDGSFCQILVNPENKGKNCMPELLGSQTSL